MRKKRISSILLPKDEGTLDPNFEFEKKVDKTFDFSTKNAAKKLISSLIDR